MEFKNYFKCPDVVFIVTFNGLHAENNQCVRSRPHASFLVIARPKMMFMDVIGARQS